MSYSTMAHALISYMESHMNDFSMKKMSESFGFSEIYLRELFLKNMGIPVKKYYKKRRLITAGFEILYSDKTIIQIALESGFSSHEAFTRAFYHLFGMTPKRFRSERPQIGRRQLDAGIFGLDILKNNMERSYDIQMKEQDKNSIMLYGIRKIEQGAYGSNTMFPICVKAVSEYLGDDIPYAHIMAATGAAFRLVWNREDWDLGNIDIYHTLHESNDIYKFGAKALGRSFSFLGRDENVTKEDFVSFINSHLSKGYPVIALGIIGPPEACIIAGYEPVSGAVMGWNFFQHDPEFATSVTIMDNGYFYCDKWWENTDTQAVMCIGKREGTPYSDKEILKNAVSIMEGREEYSYAKGINAYDAWREMLLDETWFRQGDSFDCLFSKLLVHNDAIVCIRDGRHWAAKYFENLCMKYDKEGQKICRNIVKRLDHVSGIAGEIMALLGNWDDIDCMLQNLKSRSVREQTGYLIDLAKKEDTETFRQIKELT